MTMKPVIGIVGGIRKETLEGVEEAKVNEIIKECKCACEALGAELARAGMRLLVWSSDPRFVEGSVLSGYLSVENVASESIICVWNKNHYPEFPRQEEDSVPFC